MKCPKILIDSSMFMMYFSVSMLGKPLIRESEMNHTVYPSKHSAFNYIAPLSARQESCRADNGPI